MLHARLGGKPYQQKIQVDLPNRREQGEAIGTLWARARIEDLSDQHIVHPRQELVEEITRVALAHRLVSAYTSFVAVEKQLVTGSEQPVLIEVPGEIPQGVSYEGVFGEEMQLRHAAKSRFAGQLGNPLLLASPAPPSEPVAQSADSAIRRAPSGQQAENRPARDFRRQKERGNVACRIETARTSYRVGEPIEILVTIVNLTGQTVQVPATLSAIDGTARFQVVDTNWKPIQHPTPNAATPKSIPLQPGARVTPRVVLNAAGGYQLSQPGTYHIVLLGRAIGLPNSNTLTIRLVP